jgi:sulfoxide reductase heme-binding subunit YedZ
VFRDGDHLHAVTNVCAHQGGPLGEGKILDGCITCPWHGYQFRAHDGCSPPPYTEKIATYELRVEGGRVRLNPTPNPPGTPTAPTPLPSKEPAHG